MNEKEIQDIAIFDSLPPEWEKDLLPEIRSKVKESAYKVVILDDDPTGTQTVHTIPILTTWDEKALVDELRSEYPAFFVLTNSRSMVESDACRLGTEIGLNLKRASAKTGVRTVVISRSDSTLRGHFPAEVDAVANVMDKRNLPYLIVPFFLEGGRYTINDIHYVKEGTELHPAAMTPFADDAAFGFNHSDLKLWVEEKSEGRIRSQDVVPVTLEDIRKGGPGRVVEVLESVSPGGACIVNAVSYRDMEVVVSALLQFESAGGEFLYRTAASIVRTRLGMEADGRLLGKDDIAGDSGKGGLFVVGSYVPKTSRQVELLIGQSDILPLEVQVEQLLDESSWNEEIWRVIRSAGSALDDGNDVVIYTSRKLITGETGKESLAIGNIVSESLIRIVRNIPVKPKFLVAKGGITSSDVATKGLEVKRAIVSGQILPGVPVWELGTETRFPGMKYIVFPGNVGEDDALVQVKTILH